MKVNRAVDVDSGRLIAVKIVKIRKNQNKEAFFKLLKREVEAIGRIEHVRKSPQASRQITILCIDNPAFRDASRANLVNSRSSSTMYATKLV